MERLELRTIKHWKCRDVEGFLVEIRVCTRVRQSNYIFINSIGPALLFSTGSGVDGYNPEMWPERPSDGVSLLSSRRHLVVTFA